MVVAAVAHTGAVDCSSAVHNLDGNSVQVVGQALAADGLVEEDHDCAEVGHVERVRHVGYAVVGHAERVDCADCVDHVAAIAEAGSCWADQ